MPRSRAAGAYDRKPSVTNRSGTKASLPLEIKDEIGAWREITHDDLKRQHEDFVRVTKAVEGRLIIHHAPPTLGLPQP